MNVNRVVAAGLAFGLMTGCASHETPSPAPETVQWTVSVPEVDSSTSVTIPDDFPRSLHVGNITVRLIRAQDLSPIDPLEEQLKPYVEQHLQSAPRAVETMAAMATNNQLHILFNPTETVTLPYSVEDRLCNIVDKNLDLDEEPSDEDKAKWFQESDAIDKEIIRRAKAHERNSHVDATLIYFDNINRCYPTALVGEGGQVALVQGDAGVDSISVDLDDTSPQVWLHELGHKWGLGHADSLDCGSVAQPVSDEGNCAIQEYADSSNAMGNNKSLNYDMFNGYQLAQLGALQPKQIVDVTKSGEFDIDALVGPSEGNKVLRFKTDGHLVPGNTKDQEYYYIELSGADDVTQCDPDGDGELIQSEPSCLKDETVSLKIIRAADYAETSDNMPQSLILRLRPEFRKYQTSEFGVEQSSDNPLFVSHDGVSVKLLGIESDGKASGKAKVSITLPKS